MSTTAVEPVRAERTLRAILREFVAHVIEGEDEIRSDELVEYALKRFEGDEELRRAAVRDVIPVVVPEILRHMVKERREDFMQTPTGARRRSKVDETARERLSKVFEGTGQGYKGFLVLRRRDLLALNERDEKSILTTRRWVELRADLAARMDDVGTVGDSFSGVDLDVAWRRHFETETPE